MSASTLTKPIEFAGVPSALLPSQPTVSVIIPCYNEERFIGKTLRNLAEQYPCEAYEIIVVDGQSEDGTREVVHQFQNSHPELSIKLVANPERSIPKALNIGIAASSGEIIARMDAHAVPSARYIRRCVEVLNNGDAEVVGMPCLVQPGADSKIAQAIALAVSHPFGIGDARYRLGAGRALQEVVDTVAFACFRRSLWSRLGGYDESLLTNEDYDFNYRARLQGDRVMLDRSEHCDYFARDTLPKLIAQYRRYGGWKARMIRQHPRSIRVRHAIAPIFVASVIVFAAIGIWNGIAWMLLATELGLYFFTAAAFAVQAARKAQAGLPAMFLVPLVFFAIHLSWGGSFLLGLVRRPS